MKSQKTPLKDCYILTPKVWKDERGYFFETFNQQHFEALTGQNGHFVQDNQSQSRYGVIRGLHFQKGRHAQAKLVRVLSGRIFDVAVDLRETSPTYQQWFGLELNDENNQQLYIPKGFAHGFSVLSPTAVVAYKCDQYYHAAAEGGIHLHDAALNIDWKIPREQEIISSKDQHWPFLTEIEDR